MNEISQRADVRDEQEHQRVSSDEGGFVLPWFALMLLLLIAMAGFGVDVWNWWYSAQQAQRAADAGALAGVVFMPGATAGTTPDPQAVSIALTAANNNGFGSSSVDVAVGAKPNQLKVTAHITVNNNFVSLLGLSTTTLSRSATAEFNEPIKMGSPQAHLANDPMNPPVDQHWLNIGAPGVDKTTGDRYADNVCGGGIYNCPGPNTDYDPTNYLFTVDVASAAAGSSFDIQVYDPEYANGGTACDTNWGGINANMANLTATFGADAPQRYGTGASMWCTGDDNTGLGTPQSTAWIVRAPDSNPFLALDNPVVLSGGPGSGGSCTKQFQGYNSDFYNLLGTDSDFAAAFHRHYTLCHITNAIAGKYFIQVRSNLTYQANASVAYLTGAAPATSSLAGQNRYSIRAVSPGTNTYKSGVSVYAERHLPIYSNVLNASGGPSSTPQFYLARLLPGGGASGRILSLIFYDIGDVGCQSGVSCTPSATIIVTPPTDATGTPPTCTWVANDNQPMPSSGTVSGCTVSGSAGSTYPSGFNGTLIRANIAVPGNYNCNTADPFGCWFKIQMTYGSGVQANDTTTWDATIGGDPVRLIQ